MSRQAIHRSRLDRRRRPAPRVRPLSDFERNAKTGIRRVRRTWGPQVPTVTGRAAIVTQDASAYQDILGALAKAKEAAAVREALRDLKAGKGRPIEDFAREPGRSRG